MSQPNLPGDRPTEERQCCEYVKSWEPVRFCGTLAHWRYPAMGGGFMYLCDEHGIKHLNQVEAAPEGGWPVDDAKR